MYTSLLWLEAKFSKAFSKERQKMFCVGKTEHSQQQAGLAVVLIWEHPTKERDASDPTGSVGSGHQCTVTALFQLVKNCTDKNFYDSYLLYRVIFQRLLKIKRSWTKKTCQHLQFWVIFNNRKLFIAWRKSVVLSCCLTGKWMIL